MTLKLDLTKDANTAPLSLSLSKVVGFDIELYWDTQHDLDAHAIALTNGRCLSLEGVLSTYNATLPLVAGGKRVAGGKEPFQTPCGGLTHMGDKRTGLSTGAQPDEVIKGTLAKMRDDWDEVAIIVAMHPPHSGKFADVQGARLVIKDSDGVERLEANLTRDFDGYDIVQMGSLVKNPVDGSWDFKPVAVGTNGTFNDVLAAFS